MSAVKTFPSRVIQIVDERRRGRCEMCGLAVPVVYHHRRPKGMGGSTAPLIDSSLNCFGICSPCHRYVHAHPAEAYERGWLLRKNMSPGDVPPQVLTGRELFELRKKIHRPRKTDSEELM